MKKIKKFLVIILCALLLSGCGEGITKADINIQEKNMPNLVRLGYGRGYYYIIDKNTGVVYLYHQDGYAAAMTVMLNADGTPVTAEQLGLEY